jgi:hypothetical protein
MSAGSVCAKKNKRNVCALGQIVTLLTLTKQERWQVELPQALEK